MPWYPSCPGPTHGGVIQPASVALFLPSSALYTHRHRKAAKLKYACASCWTAIGVSHGRQLTADDLINPPAFRRALDEATNRAIGTRGVGIARLSVSQVKKVAASVQPVAKSPRVR